MTSGRRIAYYGRPPAFSYWDGCSTGGREAAVEAQRFPDDFDGIAAGDLFMNAIEIAMEQLWSSAVFFRDVNGDGVGFDNNITQADIDALRDAVLAKCDVLENDEIRDNVVGNPLACARVFTSADIDALGVARGLPPTAGKCQSLSFVNMKPGFPEPKIFRNNGRIDAPDLARSRLLVPGRHRSFLERFGEGEDLASSPLS